MSVNNKLPLIPSYLKSARVDARPVTLREVDISEFSVNTEDRLFKRDPLSYPLKSTQQLNLDWSKFENHTFFSSAEVKVNEAFNNIINSYPFDGSKQEVESFFDKLTGYEKYVFDQFPKWRGSLHFSGTQVGENPANGFTEGLGSWISVKDKSGQLYPSLSKNNSGETTINPDADTSFTIEAQVFLPAVTNDTQVIFQKSSTTKDGFSFHINPSATTTEATAVFSVSSGSTQNKVEATVKKGVYNHLCVTINKEDFREHTLQFFLNEKLAAKSEKSVYFGKLSTDSSNFLIGSGTSFYSNGSLVTPTQTFSGTLDELRIFHEVRDEKKQKLYATKGIYATPELKLYYRFNEPPPSLSLTGLADPVNAIVLDSSGNSLHSTIQNFTGSLRVNSSLDTKNPVINERDEFAVVLFPAYQSVLDLNSQLLTSASLYDRANPNIITNLIPRHYLLESAAQEGFDSETGNGGDAYGGSGIPGQGSKGSVQIILTFLYIWSKFFDELKTLIDAFGTMRTVDYDTNDTVPNNFLEDIVRENGLYLPPFFSHSTVEQYAEGENIGGISASEIPLKDIHAALMRRVVINLPSVIRSKGTQHSIRSFLRSIGIDPDNSLKIREYGGSTTKQLSTSRSKKVEPGAMVNFLTSTIALSSPLSSSRVEPGYPNPAGTFIKNSLGRNIGTTSASDGLLTSGSWSVEGFFKIPAQKLSEITNAAGHQSLFRMVVTGSAATSKPGVLANVVITPENTSTGVPSRLLAYVRPGNASTSPLLKMQIDLAGKGIFDGDKWYVSLGCERNDAIQSSVSSSYFLRAASAEQGELTHVYQTASYLYEQPNAEGNLFRTLDSSYNASGSYVAIGQGQTIPSSISYRYLNDTLNVLDDEARATDFIGWASNVRFWSKSLSQTEWKEHARNYKSTGVDDALTNFNFVTEKSGSFERLRLDSFAKQPIRNADASGNITLLDFSTNNKHVSVAGYSSGSKALVGDLFSYSYLSADFDEVSVDNKVRIRSLINPSTDELEENPWAVPAPSHYHLAELRSEEPQDDTRLSIEFSLVDALNRDIANMFATFDEISNAIGNPDLAFSPDYPRLESLRDVYFNKLSEKVNFRSFLEFYRWFDISISTFVEQLVPSKTRYKGTNFVVESHLLERHKKQYYHNEMYMGDKRIVNDSLLIQQVVGNIRKY